MKVDDRLRALVANIPNVLPTLGPPEEARSKTAIAHALVMPLIAALGYDLFNPREVTRDEDIDFTILHEGAAALLLELRSNLGMLGMLGMLGTLADGPGPGLVRAHASTGARAAIVTDGVVYLLYADTRERGVLDDRPTIVLDLRALDEGGVLIADLCKLGKASFDLDGLLAAARQTPRAAAIEAALAGLLAGPDPELVALIQRRVDPEGALDPAAHPGFTRDVASAITRLRARSGRLDPTPMPMGALESAPLAEPTEPDDLEPEHELPEDGPIETTEEELAGYALVRELVGDLIPLARLGYRDRRRFFGIIIDGDEHKTLCRLHFNRVRKYVGIFAGPTREKKHRVANVEAIVELREPLREAARRWTGEAEPR